MGISSLKVKNRLWIVGQQGTFLGEGRIELLQAIEQYGSISKAAKSMNMSYLKAWKLIDSMNNVSDKPVVIRESGGKGGGGTTITDFGKQAITLYNELNKRCNIYLNAELKLLLKAKKLK
jgi:molybdate transport system regulatory protein